MISNTDGKISGSTQNESGWTEYTITCSILYGVNIQMVSTVIKMRVENGTTPVNIKLYNCKDENVDTIEFYKGNYQPCLYHIIADNEPKEYGILPSLPSGLLLMRDTGVIYGTSPNQNDDR